VPTTAATAEQQQQLWMYLTDASATWKFSTLWPAYV